MGLSRETYDQRKAEGLCVQCAGPADGKTKCRSCSVKDKEARQRREQERKAAGICTACGVPAMPERSLCKRCSATRTAITTERYYKRKAQSICRDCGVQVKPNTARCEACQVQQREYQKVRYRLNKESGQCVFCPQQAIEGKTYCTSCRTKAIARNKKIWKRLRQVVLDHYGNKCNCPGCHHDTPAYLQMDHINGGGNQHRREIGWSGLYRWLIKNNFPPGFQVLCANCNFAKGHYGACPHEGRPH